MTKKTFTQTLSPLWNHTSRTKNLIQVLMPGNLQFMQVYTNSILIENLNTKILNVKAKSLRGGGTCRQYVHSNWLTEFIKSKSAAAAGLCSWVINIVKFFDVYCDVEPKRRALDEANAELLAARQKLTAVKNKVS